MMKGYFKFILIFTNRVPVSKDRFLFEKIQWQACCLLASNQLFWVIIYYVYPGWRLNKEIWILSSSVSLSWLASLKLVGYDSPGVSESTVGDIEFWQPLLRSSAELLMASWKMSKITGFIDTQPADIQPTYYCTLAFSPLARIQVI